MDNVKHGIYRTLCIKQIDIFDSNTYLLGTMLNNVRRHGDLDNK
jgi:hypothetical protein